MKKTVIFMLLIATLASKAQSIPETQAPAIKRATPRATFMSYHNRDIAAANDYTKSDYYLPLDMMWLSIRCDIKDRPADFFELKYIPEGKSSPQIGDPVGKSSPQIDDLEGKSTPQIGDPEGKISKFGDQSNTFNLSRTQFEIPLNWLDRDVFVNLGGVSWANLYVNGHKIEVVENRSGGAEYCINKYITNGTNVLGLERFIPREWSLTDIGATLVNDPSHGLYVYSQPKVRIEDYYVTQSLDSTYRDGILGLDVAMINNFNRASGPMQVWFELENADGTIIDYSYQERAWGPNSRDTVRFERRVKNVRPWSAEDPYLYKLVIKVRQNGNFTEYTSQNIGFRTSEVKNGRYLINGMRVFLKGINVTFDGDRDQTLEEMTKLKHMNINAIKIGTNTQNRHLYELADRLGFYICNVANTGDPTTDPSADSDRRRGASPGNNPACLATYVDRTETMYQRLKNFPSIILWSLGEQTSNGYNLYKTYQWLKSHDASRPILFQAAEYEWNTDIVVPWSLDHIDWSVWRAEPKSTDRPIIISQQHINGILVAKQIASRTGLFHGVFFDTNLQSTQESTFITNTFQGIKIYPVDAGTGSYEVHNQYDFTNSNRFTIKYTISEGTKVVARGTFPLALAPNGIAQIYVPMVNIKTSRGVAYYVDFETVLTQANGVMKKGTVVGQYRYLLSPGR